MGVDFRSDMLNIRKPPFNAAGDGQVDDSSALNEAIKAENLAFLTRKTVKCVYAPAGNYKLKSIHITTFVGPGCIIGDGQLRTRFYLDKDYQGDLFTWSESWAKRDFAYNAAIVEETASAGALIKGLTVMGNRYAPSQQNAFSFYDREDFVLMRDVSVFHTTGWALSAGKPKLQTESYLRESKFYNLLFWSCGSPGIPTVELTSSGAGDATNELSFFGLDIVGSRGPGIVITNDNAHTPTRLVDFFSLRLEASESDDLMRIGDPSKGGAVADIGVYGLRANGSAPNKATIRFASQSQTSQPYNIRVRGVIASGSGQGVVVESGRNLTFELMDIATKGSPVVIGPSPPTGDNLVFDGGGAELGWKMRVDPTASTHVRAATGKNLGFELGTP